VGRLNPGLYGYSGSSFFIAYSPSKPKKYFVWVSKFVFSVPMMPAKPGLIIN